MKWRQGDILSSENLHTLTSPQEQIIIPKKTLAIAISHSCDIVNDEPTVEFIYAAIADKKDGKNM